MNVIYEDMRTRIADRARDTGDTPKTRDFAARVLKPYAEACLITHREYDMEADIEGIISNA